MKKRKLKLKSMLLSLIVILVGITFGYTVLIPGDKPEEKTSPFAYILIDPSTGAETLSSINSTTQPGYEFDHAVCDNGGTITFNETTGKLDGVFTSADKCTLYYIAASDFQITSIKVNNVEVNSIPTEAKYIGSVDCGTTAAATWNHASWSLEITSINLSAVKCSLSFTSPSGTNFANYIKGLITSGNQVTAGTATTTNGSTTTSAAENGILINENGYRYEGINPNNYVLFNNELWRIIGVFDTYSSATGTTSSMAVSGSAVPRVKLIRNESIGSFAFDYTTSRSATGNGNAWSYNGGQASNLNQILNNYYFTATNGTDAKDSRDSRDSNNYLCMFYGNSVRTDCDFRKSGIQSTYRTMVDDAVWYTRGYSSATNTEAMYAAERTASGAVNNASDDIMWVGKVGLMYPSDYGYSVIANGNCTRSGTNLSSYSNTNCGGKSWLLKYGYEWTISPYSSDAGTVWILNSSGYVNDYNATLGFSARPSLYLSSNTYFVSGDGTKDNPYVIIGA